jgi:hypothetical protein
MVDIDKEYWEDLQNGRDSTDPLAIVLGRLEALLNYGEVIAEVLPSIIQMLKVERKTIVKQTEKRFSDVLNMIDEFGDEEESSYETAVKLCDYYRNKGGQNGKD